MPANFPDAGHDIPQVQVLGYHKIGMPPPNGWNTWYYIPEATFAGHLEYLQKQEWVFIDHARFLTGLSDPASLPKRAVLITFDDGYRSCLEVAVPVLRRFNCPSVVFMPVGYIGDMNKFDVGIEPEEPLCDWNELRTIERAGVSVQSHGVWHRAQSTLTPQEQEDEFIRSKAVLEQGLEKEVETFSFPYGDPGLDPETTEHALIRAGYRAAFLYGGHPLRWPPASPYFVTRHAMGPDSCLSHMLEQVPSDQTHT